MPDPDRSPATVASAALSIAGLLCKHLIEKKLISRLEFANFVDNEIRRRLESPRRDSLVNQQVAGELSELLRLALEP